MADESEPIKIRTLKEVRLSNGLVIRAKVGRYGPFMEYSKLLEDRDISFSDPDKRYLSVSTPNVGDAAAMRHMAEFFTQLSEAHDERVLISESAMVSV